MANDPYERRLGFLIHDVARLMRRRFDRQAQQLGLTRAQWSVLFHLHRNEGSTQAAIAQRMDIQPITLVRLIDRLEADGWVERRSHPRDRRAKALYLTAKVHPILEQMQAISTQVRSEAVAGMDADAIEQLLGALTEIKANLQRLECTAAAEEE